MKKKFAIISILLVVTLLSTMTFFLTVNRKVDVVCESYDNLSEMTLPDLRSPKVKLISRYSIYNVKYKDKEEVLTGIDIIYEDFSNDGERYYVTNDGYFYELSFSGLSTILFSNLVAEFHLEGAHAFSFPTSSSVFINDQNEIAYSELLLGITNFEQLKEFYKDLETAEILEDEIKIKAYELGSKYGVGYAENKYITIKDKDNSKVVISLV